VDLRVEVAVALERAITNVEASRLHGCQEPRTRGGELDTRNWAVLSTAFNVEVRGSHHPCDHAL